MSSEKRRIEDQEEEAENGTSHKFQKRSERERVTKPRMYVYPALPSSRCPTTSYSQPPAAYVSTHTSDTVLVLG